MSDIKKHKFYDSDIEEVSFATSRDEGSMVTLYLRECDLDNITLTQDDIIALAKHCKII